ncbi:MAG: PTS sugar transporter subunit IIC, partial [Lactococcus raffinolactis]
ALTIFVRTITVFFIHKADEMAKKGNYKGIERAHLLAMSLQALRVMIPTLIISLISATAVQNFLSSIPEVITRGLQIGGGIIVVVGYAMVINMMDVPYLKPFMYAGFLFAAFTNFNLVGFGALGLIAAMIYLQLKYNGQPQVAAAPAGVVFDDDDDDLDA